MARRKRPHYSLDKMAKHYDDKTPRMAENYLRVKDVIASRWKEGMTRLLKTEPLTTFVEAMRKGIEEGAPLYAENIKGKGKVLVKNFYEKLTGKVVA